MLSIPRSVRTRRPDRACRKLIKCWPCGHMRESHPPSVEDTFFCEKCDVIHCPPSYCHLVQQRNKFSLYDSCVPLSPPAPHRPDRACRKLIKCWSCGHIRGSHPPSVEDTFFCEKCNVIQAPHPDYTFFDYFDMYGGHQMSESLCVAARVLAWWLPCASAHVGV